MHLHKFCLFCLTTHKAQFGILWATVLPNVGRSKATSNLVVSPYSGNRAMNGCRQPRALLNFAINDVNDAIVRGTRRSRLQRHKKPASHLRVALRISLTHRYFCTPGFWNQPYWKTSKGKRVLLQVWMPPPFPNRRPHMEAHAGHRED